uniref:Uncharacterized protein n=1 Tax=Alexandrium andersonii TaxID=327968 RepID=A0A7S2MXA1_9DINO
MDFFMDCFNDKFYQMLKRRYELFLEETRSVEKVHDSNLVRYTKGLPEDSHPSVARLYDLNFESECRLTSDDSDPDATAEHKQRWLFVRGLVGCARRAFEADDRPQLQHAETHLHEPGDFNIILALHEHYAQWWYDWCHLFQKLAATCTWCAIIFNVLCCAVLLGMYYQFNYPDTPAMWRLYSSLLLIGLGLALALTLCAHLRGPRLDAAKKKWIKSRGGGIPEWMNEAGAHLLEVGSLPSGA